MPIQLLFKRTTEVNKTKAPRGIFHEETIAMFNRRSLMVGGLVMAAAPSLARVAQAQAGRPTLVFVGHEL